jgi:hypothetical protein
MFFKKIGLLCIEINPTTLMIVGIGFHPKTRKSQLVQSWGLDKTIPHIYHYILSNSTKTQIHIIKKYIKK